MNHERTILSIFWILSQKQQMSIDKSFPSSKKIGIDIDNTIKCPSPAKM